jgi:2-haloacid dehalogenase
MTQDNAQITVVFDFGGVLFRTSATEFYRERFQAQGRSEAELQHFITKVFTHAERSASHTGDLKDMIEKKVRQYPEWEEDIRAFGADRDYLKQVRNALPGMKEVLDDIAGKGYRIVGLTNWAGDTYDTLDRKFPDMLAHFNAVVVSGKVGLVKPNPDIFTLAQQTFGDPDPATVYYFDDKPENIAAARKAVGWNGIVFENANTVRHALALKPKVA